MLARSKLILFGSTTSASGSGSTDAPSAPIIDWTSAPSDTTPEFTIDFDDTVVATDIVTVQYANNSLFSSPTEFSDTLSAAEILAQQLGPELITLGAGTYYVRAKITHASKVSAWSNTETVSIVPLTKSYTYRGAGTTSIGGSVGTYSIDIGTASADRLVIVGTTVGTATTISSVTVNGATLTADVSAVNTYRCGIHSGLVTTGDGAVTVVVTWASASFQEKNAFLWTAIGLTSNAVKLTANGLTAANITATVDDFIFSVSRNVAGFPDFSGSTETPDGTRQVGASNASADWSVNATNAAFNVNAAAPSNQMVAASYA